MSRRAGPVQRGAVILREGSGERTRTCRSRPQAARDRSRLTWSARVAWVLSRSSSARSSSRRPVNARLHTATSDTEPSMLPHSAPPTGRGRAREYPIRRAPVPSPANRACPPAQPASRAAGAAGVCSPAGAGVLRSRWAVGLQFPGRPAARPCCASVSGRRGGGW